MRKPTILLTVATAVFTVLGNVAVAATPEGYYTIYGEELDNCSQFVSEWKKNSERFYFHGIWLLGYMTAAGLYNDTQKTFNRDGDSVLHLAIDYCEENPLDSLANAAYYVAKQLINRAGRR